MRYATTAVNTSSSGQIPRQLTSNPVQSHQLNYTREATNDSQNPGPAQPGPTMHRDFSPSSDRLISETDELPHVLFRRIGTVWKVLTVARELDKVRATGGGQVRGRTISTCFIPCSSNTAPSYSFSFNRTTSCTPSSLKYLMTFRSGFSVTGARCLFGYCLSTGDANAMNGPTKH